jgi:hypothetical protein
MADLAPDIEAGLIRYLAIRDQSRARQVDARLARLTDHERQLVREAAVMGYVLGHMSGEVQGRKGLPPMSGAIPKDGAIVAKVLLCCRSQSDLYPILGEHVEDDDDEA